MRRAPQVMPGVLRAAVVDPLTAPEGAERLPRWVRLTFWSVVAVEWTVALSATVLALVASVYLGIAVSCVNERTVYASGYSEGGWSGIRVGDTQQTVLARLGEPLDRWEHPDDFWWSFSRQATGTDDYFERKLRFSPKGILMEKHEECWID